jgi:tryptophan synthase alpha chain
VSRYAACFEALRARNEKAFVPFFVIGDPDYRTSLQSVRAALDAGADMLELGIGFSDPIADGPSIQAADLRALHAGMTVDRCFRLIEEIRRRSDVPIGLLVYYNLVLRRGVARFCRQAAAAGVDGILAADVPIEEAGPVVEGCRAAGIDPIFMVAPTTTEERLRKILMHASGFLYLVALLGVTGARGDLHPETIRLVRKVRSRTDLPLCVGFGISRPEHVRAVGRAGADGAIVGSAIVNLIARNLGSRDATARAVARYVRAMKKQTLPEGPARRPLKEACYSASPMNS